MHRLIPKKLSNKIFNQIVNKINKYAIVQWQENGCAQLPMALNIKSQRVFLKEIYPDEDVKAIFKAILNLEHPIR